MTRPKVAVVATTYFRGSHADVCATRLIEGYEFGGVHKQPRVQVVSMYLEQLGDHVAAKPRADIGVEICDRNAITLYPTVAEALGCGRPGVAVDGVVIIGEHGDYEFNEFGQQLYPRRRLFDAAVSTMIGAGRTVPIFNDKHLAWSFTDAEAMYDTARRLGIPLLAGSTVPLAWRIPPGTQWPLDERMDAAVMAGFGPTDRYGIHILEGLQAHVERRSGGETGVTAVQALTDSAAVRAVDDGTVDAHLLDRALRTFDLNHAQRDQARQSVKDVFLIDYADGLRAAAVNCGEMVRNFGAACRGPEHEMACQTWLQHTADPAAAVPAAHFIFLVRQIETMMLTGVAPYPVERTLLTTGILDAALRSRHDDGARRETPELAIAYKPVADVPDTGVTLYRGPIAAVELGVDRLSPTAGQQHH